MSGPDMKLCRRILDSFQTLNELLGTKMPNNIKGLAGEVMVWDQLAEKRFDFEPKGGQSGYDILLESGAKLEVRTSRLIRQPDDSRGWAWQLQKKNEDNVRYDYIICVAFGESLKVEDAQFFILSRKDAMQAKEVDLPRFRNVRRKLWVYESFDRFLIERKKDSDGKIFNDWEEEFNRNKDEYQNWEVLRRKVV